MIQYKVTWPGSPPRKRLVKTSRLLSRYRCNHVVYLCIDFGPVSGSEIFASHANEYVFHAAPKPMLNRSLMRSAAHATSPTVSAYESATSPATTSTPTYLWLNTSSLPSCTNNCSISFETGGVYSWLRLQITETLTYATVLYLIQNGTNSTSTTTIYNTELGTVTPPTYTNSAGTITTQFSTWNPYSSQYQQLTLYVISQCQLCISI